MIFSFEAHNIHHFKISQSETFTSPVVWVFTRTIYWACFFPPERKFGAKCIINDVFNGHLNSINLKNLVRVYRVLFYEQPNKPLYSWSNSKQMNHHWSKSTPLYWNIQIKKKTNLEMEVVLSLARSSLHRVFSSQKFFCATVTSNFDH